MALILSDRVKETTSTTGTGTYTLAGAATGFESFASIGNSNTTYYCCTDGTDFEVGIGTYTSSGTTLARTTILQSSNSDSAVSWTSGTRQVFCTLPAEKSIVKDASDHVTLATDGTIINFGANSEIDLQHVHDIGLKITNSSANATLQFVDANESVSSDGTNLLLTSGGSVITVPNTAGTISLIAATETLTNKTITTPTLTTPIANAGIQLKNGATSAGFLEFFEDSDNGTNKVTLIGPASTADATLTLPSATDTLVGKATTDTLTNKTLTTPIINGFSGTGDGSIIGNLTEKASGGTTLSLQTSATSVSEGDTLGKIIFQAPDEASADPVPGAIPNNGEMPAFEIAAIAASDFSGTTNATKLSFKANDGFVGTPNLLEMFSINPDDTVSLPLNKLLFRPFGGDYNDCYIELGVTSGKIRNSLVPITDASISYEAHDHLFKAETGNSGTTPTYTNILKLENQIVALQQGVSLTFEGASSNDHETKLTVVDPTADRTITLPDETGKINLSTAKKRFMSQQDFLSKNVSTRYKYVTPLSGYYYSQFTWYANRAYVTPWVINGSDDHTTVIIDEVAIRTGFNQSGYGGGTCLIGMFDLNEFGAPDNLLYETTITIPASVANNTTVSSSALTWSVKPGVYAMVARKAGNNLVCAGNSLGVSGGSFYTKFFEMYNNGGRPQHPFSSTNSTGTLLDATSPASYSSSIGSEYDAIFNGQSNNMPFMYYRYNTDF